MKTKHTPKPWRLCEDASGTAFIFCKPNGAPLYIKSEAEREANRRLAEHAPELIHMLQALLEKTHGGLGFREFEKEYGFEMNECRSQCEELIRRITT